MSSWVNGNLQGRLSIGQGERGKSLEYEWRGTELGIRQEGEEEYQFVNLVSGADGQDGREIELQVGNGYIQWRYKGEEEWNNLISIDSLKGGKGDKGEQGVPGRDGADGTNGKDGVTPNIQVGTVTTLEAGQQATVVKRGTIENPIFDFGIPKGENGGSNGATFIDDTTISTEKTWSSTKIEDFVHTNDDVVWTTVQGENLSIEYTKEGYLREVEIWGNTWQDTYNSKNLFNKDNVDLLKETVNEASSYTVEGNTVKFEIPNSGNQFKLRIRLDRSLDVSKSYKISYSSYRAFVNGEWITSGITEGSQSIEEGNIFNISFIKDWLPITKFEVTNLQIEEGIVATSYEPYHKADLSDIRHLGELYVDEEGQLILDSEGREQYKIEITSYSDLAYRNIQYNGGKHLGNNRYSLKPNGAYAMCNFQLNPSDVNIGDKFKIILEIESKTEDISWDDVGINYFTANAFGNNVNLDKRIGKQIIEGIIQKTPSTLNRFFLIQTSPSVKTGEIIFKLDIIFEKESHKTTLLLPCQLMKVGNVADRLYWNSEKGKYVVEKNIGVIYPTCPWWNNGNWDETSVNIACTIASGSYIVDDSKEKYINNYGFVYNSTYDLQNNGKLGIDYYDYLNETRIQIRGLKSELGNTLEEVQNTFDKKTFVAYGVYKTPQLIETNISEQILLPSYKDKTHLFVNGGIDGGIKAKVPLNGGQAIQSLSARNVALNEEVSTLSLENEELKSTNDTQDELINTTMLATDEMYMMLEPLLSEVAQTLSLERSVRNPMVDMYVAMVMRGLKTVEQVPARYREEVREILAQLEK